MPRYDVRRGTTVALLFCCAAFFCGQAWADEASVAAPEQELGAVASDGDDAGAASFWQGAPVEAPLSLLSAGVSSAPGEEHGGQGAPTLTHTIALHGRLIHFPGFVLDEWFTVHSNTWQGQANIAAGLDYVLRIVGVMEVQLGLFWTDLSMQDQYWLEERKRDDWTSAKYTRQSLSVLAMEVNAFGYYDFLPEFGFFYGGGVWLGGILGDVQRANVREDCAQNAQAGLGELQACPHDPVFLKEQAVPNVIGFASVSAGLRFQFEERMVLRLEGGFKGYFFGGLSLGAQFF